MEPTGETSRRAQIEVGLMALLLVLVFAITYFGFFKEYRAEMRGGAIVFLIAAILHLCFNSVRYSWFRAWLAPMVLILGVVGGYLVAKWLEPTPRTLLYISPVAQPSDQPFYGELIDELVHQAKQAGFEVTVWLPNKDFDPQSQKELLFAAEKQRGYAALIFSPFTINREEDEDTLLDFFAKSKGLNVILFDMDVSKSLQEHLADRGLDIPPCVKGDEDKGGELAAQATLEYFRSRRLMKPRVVVFDRERGGSQRASVYQARLKQGEDGLKPTVRRWLTTRYSREEAFQTALRELAGGEEVDAVFAANDVSALGVRDAIRQLRHRKPPVATNTIKIVGYDGINEVNRLLQDPTEEFLVNSVDVRLPDQVGGLVWLTNQLLSDKPKTRPHPGRPCTQKEPRLLRAASLPALQ